VFLRIVVLLSVNYEVNSKDLYCYFYFNSLNIKGLRRSVEGSCVIL
jgi:hypothetical protein